MNILELLNPSDKTALIQGRTRLSYRELLDNGLRLGGRLRRDGIATGDPVLIFTPLSAGLYIAMIGAWSVGAVPVFIDYSRGAKFIADNVDRLKPRAILCDKLTRLICAANPKLRTLPAISIIPPKNLPVVFEQLEEGHPAILTSTSGTTGAPKIAVRTHGFLINQYHALKNHVDFNPEQIDLGTLPVFILANLAAGMTTLLPDKSHFSKPNARRLAAKMSREGVTRAVCSPALMGSLLRHNPLPGLKKIYLGGAPVYPSLLNRMREDLDAYIVYGSTEAEPISGVRWSDVNAEDRKKISGGAGLLVGKIVPEIQCRIGDDDEILVSGETVLKGYLDGIGDSENKIREGDTVWHKTGDAGIIDDHGRLWLLGRVSQAVRDKHGTLFPFCAECILDAYFGIRSAVLTWQGERTAVIEKGDANPNEVLEVLKPLHITRVLEVKKIPMDKRHGAKIDYERLIQKIE